jgi:hypothetical protein
MGPVRVKRRIKPGAKSKSLEHNSWRDAALH